MFRKIILATVALVALSACAGPRDMAMTPPPSPHEEPVPAISPNFEFASCRMLTITVDDPNAPFDIDVEPDRIEHLVVAEFPTTPAEMQKGLQDRAPLHPDTAMLFEFPGDHNPVLWMKDTPSSLDMVFFDKRGDVFYLEAGTTPNSTRFLSPEEPDPVATHVLELPAGKAEDMGIFPGLSDIAIGPVAPCVTFVPAPLIG
jgi:uncharacterized membrane protein (UPF0127 family)